MQNLELRISGIVIASENLLVRCRNILELSPVFFPLVELEESQHGLAREY